MVHFNFNHYFKKQKTKNKYFHFFIAKFFLFVIFYIYKSLIQNISSCKMDFLKKIIRHLPLIKFPSQINHSQIFVLCTNWHYSYNGFCTANLVGFSRSFLIEFLEDYHFLTFIRLFYYSFYLWMPTVLYLDP